MTFNRHDAALLSDLKLQPIWLCAGYVVLGVVAIAAGWQLDGAGAKALCVGGGFLTALGAEMLVTRRIRHAALALIHERGSAHQ